MDLNDAATIITGGASGLGAATAVVFTEMGARVALFDVDIDAGTRVSAETGCRFFKVDVTSEAEVSAGLAGAELVHGTARILVNCAGIGMGAATASPRGAHPMELFREIVEVNLIGTFNCISKFAARIIAARPSANEENGVIINTASIAAFEGQAGQAGYAASKSGIVGMTLPIARDLAPHAIRVVTIAPGMFETPLLRQAPAATRGALLEQTLFPRRFGQSAEFARAARMIVENPMFNASTLRLDGGLRMPQR